MSVQPQYSVLEYLKSPKRIEAVSRVAPSHVNAEIFVRGVINSVITNPDLQNCTPMSVYACALRAAEVGIPVGPGSDLGHLVPLTIKGVKECQFWISYKGMIDLLYRSGQIADVHLDVVMNDDIFEHEGGSTIKIRHIKGEGARTPDKVKSAFFVAHTVHGGTIYEILTRWELENMRSMSKAKNFGPWVDHTVAMFRKCPMRSGWGQCPKSPEIIKVGMIEAHNEHGGLGHLDMNADEILEGEGRELGLESDKGTEALKSKIADPGDGEEYNGNRIDAQGNLIEGDQ